MLAELKRIFHWGPLIALFIINCITLTTLYITSMWLPATDSILAIFNHLIFVMLVGLTMYNFFCAACLGPGELKKYSRLSLNSYLVSSGHVPLNWQPKVSHRSKLQFCTICKGYKAPRAHHCRKCGRCVLKMDHHCPWINNCCGHRNHAYFTMFLASAVIGSIHSLILLSIGIYRGWHGYYYYQLTGK